MLTKDKIIDEFIEVLNRKEVKHEFKKMMAPLIELILKQPTIRRMILMNTILINIHILF